MINDLPYDVYKYISYEYQISITEDDIKSMKNIDELVSVIAEKVSKNKSTLSNAFLFEDVIHQKIEEALNQDFDKIDVPEKVISKSNRQALWKKLEQETGYHFPVLKYPKALQTGFAFLGFLLTMGLLIFSTITVGLDIFNGWIFLSAVPGIAITLAIYQFSGGLRQYIDSRNFKTLYRSIFLINKMKFEPSDFIPEKPILEQKIKTSILEVFDLEKLNQHVFS